MKIKKRVYGELVDMVFEKIRDYKSYSLYRVYKIVKRGAYTFIYGVFY